MSTRGDLSSAVVYICSGFERGEVKPVNEISHLGTKNICAAEETIFALTSEGVYDVFSLTLAVSAEALSMTGGQTHNLLLSGDGNLYSWGSGAFGELGLGPKNTEMETPGQIRFQVPIVSIAAGRSHSCAVDKFGNVYSWGQNFSRQLGLYTKSREQMPVNALIEELVMTPRISPFSVQNSIAKVACGAEFTVALTKVSLLVQIYIDIFDLCMCVFLDGSVVVLGCGRVWSARYWSLQEQGGPQRHSPS